MAMIMVIVVVVVVVKSHRWKEVKNKEKRKKDNKMDNIRTRITTTKIIFMCFVWMSIVCIVWPSWTGLNIKRNNFLLFFFFLLDFSFRWTLDFLEFSFTLFVLLLYLEYSDIIVFHSLCTKIMMLMFKMDSILKIKFYF